MTQWGIAPFSSHKAPHSCRRRAHQVSHVVFPRSRGHPLEDMGKLPVMRPCMLNVVAEGISRHKHAPGAILLLTGGNMCLHMPWPDSQTRHPIHITRNHPGNANHTNVRGDADAIEGHFSSGASRHNT